MHVVIVGLAFLVYGQAAFAAPAEGMLQAAGLSPLPKPLPAAADFQLPSIKGNTLRLHDQRGKVVFLNFWATWCAPCRHEMPLMQQLYQSLQKQRFVMWAVAMQENRAQVAPFLDENHLRFPALLDLDGAVSARYAIKGLPTTYLIDCAGKIIGKAVGPRPWNNDAVRTLLAALLSEQSCR